MKSHGFDALVNFAKKGLKGLFVILILCSCNSKKTTDQISNAGVDIEVPDEVTVEDIHQAFNDGLYSVTQLTQFYLDRIEALDKNGPQLNSVLAINPDALAIAAKLDKEWQEGKIRGPLHGIPIMLKDNIDTADKMPCTAGSRVMRNSYPLKDSPLAAQLRKAGAVILGKTNLSEWANFHSSYSSSGWSGLGGQTNNPYDLSRNPCGSSAGSAVAVAANLCVIAIGTETNGSIVCPANNNGIVGIKPTVGLISRTGIIPISFTQDSGGPMARTVKDAAICLGALTAIDKEDDKTMASNRIAYSDYMPFLKTGTLEGKRLGYYKKPLENHQRMTGVMEEAVDYFKEQGAEIIEITEILDNKTEDNSFEVLLYEFKDGLNKYLNALGENAPVKDLQELVDKTFADSIEMKYFDHGLLKLAESKGNLTDQTYKKALNEMLFSSREKGIDRVMDENNLDAIISPTGGPAWKSDLTNGDNFSIESSSPSAIAGYPIINVPMGQIDGLPVGLSIFGRAWSEPMLLEIAYNYEQGTQNRQTPKFSGKSSF